jgi:hypothetical protein
MENMNEEITFSVNDTSRVIAGSLEHLKKWRVGNNWCNQYFTDLLIAKLEEAYLLSLKMVEIRKEEDECPRCNGNGCPDCENIKWNIKD